MTLFRQKTHVCTICKKGVKHKHKPKNEWNVEGPLCADCYVDQMQKFHDLSLKQRCVTCNVEKDVPDMWEPRYQWDMKGLLCKDCFDRKDSEFKTMKDFCRICEKKLGMIRYNPKSKWGIEGQLCRECWDSRKAEMG